MRYHYKKPEIFMPIYGRIYICDHPVYSQCTLYEIGGKGLCVIQQRYDPKTKRTWWNELDPWLANDIYLHPHFRSFFEERANSVSFNLYPTITVRQIMWALKMKPIPKEPWETVFDRRNI